MTNRNLDVHFSSASAEWATPQDLFDEVDREFGFTLDVCATAENAKCERFFDKQQDGLRQRWEGTCWMNPPYGDAIPDWMAKAHREGKAGAVVVCLVPARIDTGWWWDHCLDGEIRFLKGRLRFVGAASSAPFPNAIVIFGRDFEPCVKWWDRSKRRGSAREWQQRMTEAIATARSLPAWNGYAPDTTCKACGDPKMPTIATSTGEYLCMVCVAERGAS